MTIQEKVKQESLEAHRARNTVASSLLTTLLADIAIIGKNAGRETTDEEAIKVVKKYLNNNQDTISRISDAEAIRRLQEENQILEKFVPKQMTDQELRGRIYSIILEKGQWKASQMSMIMNALKQDFGGRYDGALASKITKEILQ